MSGVISREVQSVYVFIEYSDGVESYEVQHPRAFDIEITRKPLCPERIALTFTPDYGPQPWMKIVRFEKKPGRSLMWALRKLLGAGQ